MPSSGNAHPPSNADLVGAGCLIFIGGSILLLTLALPLGYFMAGSTNVGLLGGVLVVGLVVATLLIKLGLAIRRP